MNKLSSHPLLFFGGGILFILLVYLIVAEFDMTNEKLEMAYTHYVKGELAKNIAERKQAFNDSLALYKKFEEEYHPTFGNGKLYYNIGNNYYQLSEYPSSLLYYERAKQLMPRDQKLNTNLNLALNQLNIKPKEAPNLSNSLLSFHYRLSLPEKLQIFFLLSVLLFALISLSIFYPFLGLNVVIILTSIAFLSFFGSLFYTQFLENSRAIILKADLLYKDTGKQYARVLETPLAPGTEVEVLSVSHGGRWIKVKTEGGIIGFAPYDTLEII